MSQRVSTSFREKNPVVIGAVSLAVVALLVLAAFRAQDLPLIGGGELAGPVMAVSVRAIEWTRAPLFAALTERRSSANRVSPGSVPAVSLARDMTAITPHSGDLFIVQTTARVSR